MRVAPLSKDERKERRRCVTVAIDRSRTSALRWQDDAEYNALVGAELRRSADVSTAVGCDDIINLVIGDRGPFAIHFDFVVVANHTTLGWTTIHHVAARTLAVISFEL
jgi:hypothetical protein